MPLLTVLFAMLAMPILLLADGKVSPPRNYTGSLEEKSQEAIIIFRGSDTPGEAKQDLILKIEVAGEAKNFAWIVPFPNEPSVAKEDPALFPELFKYVEHRQRSRSGSKGELSKGTDAKNAAEDEEKVEVLSRKTIGDFDIAIVKEHEEGGLNPWLKAEGFQTLDDAEDVLKFYREKDYVYACMKVSSEALAAEKVIETHPLRFTFKTGGRDGIYFPMKLTSLQTDPFDVNLYVFYGAWLNDNISQFGYEHRGFHLRHRDWDTKACEANAGKSYSLPAKDPYLRDSVGRLAETTKLFQKLHPGQKFYLTNIQAYALKPSDVREWPDDLWLFPYYTRRSMIPYDARPDGPAHGAYPHVSAATVNDSEGMVATHFRTDSRLRYGAVALIAMVIVGLVALALVGCCVWLVTSRRRPQPIKGKF